LISNGETV